MAPRAAVWRVRSRPRGRPWAWKGASAVRPPRAREGGRARRSDPRTRKFRARGRPRADAPPRALCGASISPTTPPRPCARTAPRRRPPHARPPAPRAGGAPRQRHAAGAARDAGAPVDRRCVGGGPGPGEGGRGGRGALRARPSRSAARRAAACPRTRSRGAGTCRCAQPHPPPPIPPAPPPDAAPATGAPPLFPAPPKAPAAGPLAARPAGALAPQAAGADKPYLGFNLASTVYPANPQPGGKITFSIVITNNGLAPFNKGGVVTFISNYTGNGTEPCGVKGDKQIKLPALLPGQVRGRPRRGPRRAGSLRSAPAACSLQAAPRPRGARLALPTRCRGPSHPPTVARPTLPRPADQEAGQSQDHRAEPAGRLCSGHHI
jgi:uncharacterized repeat protein (TIGR01451 family)